MHISNKLKTQIVCFHCGENCDAETLRAYDKHFCCSGCKMVFEILNEKGMCEYYEFSKNPGIKQAIAHRSDKFSYLDEPSIANALIHFNNETQSHICFFIPQIHCTSCLWLLENLHRINESVISCKVNFVKKEVDIVFEHQGVSIRELVQLLTSIGYEPYISLHDMLEKKEVQDHSKLYKLGVAGFCFANIMLMSFPEYFGIDSKEKDLLSLFRYANLLLSLPVFFYSATEFYFSAWKSLQHKFLNIDAPIVLAILVTFGRSLYEVISGTGGGYFDSMSGIVFFMLAGRVLQDKTYQELSFERDYTSYFPIAVSRIKNNQVGSVALKDIQLNDTLLIHHEELIPADGILTKGNALIDYSFVTGESMPVAKEMGEIVYAGGKQVGANIEILVIKEVVQSYLTKLWNRQERNTKTPDQERSFVHLLSRYFTWILFTLAAITAFYWIQNDPSKLWNAVTAVLIIACPCALLLSNTFTNANIIRSLGRHQLYIRNAQVIEDIATADCIVFDKTGTLTSDQYQEVHFTGKHLNEATIAAIGTIAAQSTHPLSRAIHQWAGNYQPLVLNAFQSVTGKGVSAFVNDQPICLGSAEFIGVEGHGPFKDSMVYISINNQLLGHFRFNNHYRDQVPAMLAKLSKKYSIAILSGDNAGEENYLRKLLGFQSELLFNQHPSDKLNAITKLQHAGKKVMMVGDGLNDAGALMQANVGIAVAENNHQFTPASDAILSAHQLHKILNFIDLCKANKKVVMGAFIISILYNVVGLFYAVQGTLSPLIAAVLMPSSSISILLITFWMSKYYARQQELS